MGKAIAGRLLRTPRSLPVSSGLRCVPSFGSPEGTLKEIAQLTGGTYQCVSSTGELSRVYTRLDRSIGWERKPTEVSGLATILVAGLFLATVVSLFWMHRLGYRTLVTAPQRHA